MFWLLFATAIVGCYGNISLEGSEGEFENYNYPAPSPSNKDTTWHITVPAGQRIKLSFLDLNMDWCSDYICFNCTVLEVMEVKENVSSELSAFCTSRGNYPAPKPISSKTRRVHVTLRVPIADENRDKAKFKIRYQAVSSSSSELLLIILCITGILIAIILIASLACFIFCRYRRPSSPTPRTTAGRTLIGIKGSPYPKMHHQGGSPYPKMHHQGPSLPVYTVLSGPPIYVTDKSSCVTVDETPTDSVENGEQKS